LEGGSVEEREGVVGGIEDGEGDGGGRRREGKEKGKMLGGAGG